VILVDTSVIIDKLKKVENPKTRLLDRLHEAKTPFGISIFTFHEVLQGARSEAEFDKLESYLSTQRIFSLPNTPNVYAGSARLFFDLRRQGVTVRNTIDVLIAFTAIINQIPLLHNDRDFDYIADKIPELKILK
jgi:hypothetical protein